MDGQIVVVERRSDREMPSQLSEFGDSDDDGDDELTEVADAAGDCPFLFPIFLIGEDIDPRPDGPSMLLVTVTVTMTR
ncbi:unnamed protein product [Onchocerca ochengi]|uniref:Uncharacterized protein n=1 Tax=Onchocerca ochengi TaxID=42157 RepID=A0A182E1S8_ONCOC|nr:unnamed protein product [Onchocerca ochengi]